MRTLSRNEWLAVTLAVLILIFFMGARFLMKFSANTSPIQQIDSTQNPGETVNPVENTEATTTPEVKPKPTNPTKPTNNMNPIIKDVVVGTGAEAKNGNLVSLKYTGKLADGTVFDSTANHGGVPFEFMLGEGQVIKGWDIGVLGMKVGGKRTFEIPPQFGYGAGGIPNLIPPNSTLYFDVELVGVKVQ